MARTREQPLKTTETVLATRKCRAISGKIDRYSPGFGRIIQPISTGVANQRVIAKTTIDRVIAIAAIKRVTARDANQAIIIVIAKGSLATIACDQGIITAFTV
jgi:hypothetical protein